jgi:hypothetical protein
VTYLLDPHSEHKSCSLPVRIISQLFESDSDEIGEHAKISKKAAMQLPKFEFVEESCAKVRTK